MSLGSAPALVVHAGSADAAAARGTVIVHHGLSGQKEVQGRELISLAVAGFLAIGVDAVGHGERRWPGFEARFQEAPDRWFMEAVRATASETPQLIDALAARGWARPGRQRTWAESLSWLERFLRFRDRAELESENRYSVGASLAISTSGARTSFSGCSFCNSMR